MPSWSSPAEWGSEVVLVWSSAFRRRYVFVTIPRKRGTPNNSTRLAATTTLVLVALQITDSAQAVDTNRGWSRLAPEAMASGLVAQLRIEFDHGELRR